MSANKKVNFSDLFDKINTDIASILRKTNNGKCFDSLIVTEQNKLWFILFNLFKSIETDSENAENGKTFKVSIDLILHILNSISLKLENNSELVNIMKHLNSSEVLLKDTFFNLTCKLNELWMSKLEYEVEIPGMEYHTVKFLLNLCISEKPVVSSIQRLCAIRKVITSSPFEKSVPSLRPLLIKLVQITNILKIEYGQKFIGQCLILSQKLMNDLHRTILLDLSSCNKKKAEYYGKSYIFSWHAATSDTRTILEKHCFQHLMETFLKEHRTSLELSKTSQNLLAVLEVWHWERKKKHPGFVTMITNAYQPILWKYLQSGYNVHKCNATDVFFKAFPLQRSDDNALEAETLFNMQYETMLASLTDDCHIVRMIGVREICNILSIYWNSFSAVQIQSLLTVITKKNARDASSAEARRMVYIALQSLVKSSLSQDYIKQILPILSDNIHDVNQKVKIAFIQLLICVKENFDSSFKYTDVVSMANLHYRLADDNAIVGQWIVKLLMRNYYTPKMPVIEWTKRFIYLIKAYRKSYRNFFFFSNKSLSFNDACSIIYEILCQLGMFVLSKSELENDNIESEVRASKKKKCNSKNTVSSSSRIEESEMRDNVSKKSSFDDAEVISGLFDIATILWVLHSIKLNKPENEEMRLKLYDVYLKYAQPFINYYKNTNLFLGVISLSGNIPASLLRINSITLPGYCLKLLKSISKENIEENKEEILCTLMALVKWGRGSDILEQITLWLDAAFETQNMNETILPRKKVKITETVQPDSVVAIYVLDTVLKQEYAKLSVLKKNYLELYRLWKFMSRIQQLIEARLEEGEPFADNLVSDKFMVLCFERYLKLIPLLKKEDEEDKENKIQEEGFINHQKEIEKVLEWGNSVLYLYLQQEHLENLDAEFLICLLESILYVSDNMITINFVDCMFHFKIAHFSLKLLDTKYGARFVKASSRIAVVINHSAKSLSSINDDLKTFSTVIPSLLSHCLNVLTSQKFSSEEMEIIEENLSLAKNNFSKILATYQDNLKTSSNLGKKARQLKLIVGFFVDCIVHIVSQEIPSSDSFLPLYSSASGLPPIANSLFSLFYNKKTWTPIFIRLLYSSLSSHSTEIKDILAIILLLRLYAIGDKKVNSEELEKTLTLAFKCLTQMKPSHNVEGIIEEINVDKMDKNQENSHVSSEPVRTEMKDNLLSENTTEAFNDDAKGIRLSTSIHDDSDFKNELITCGLQLVESTKLILGNRKCKD